MDFGENKRTRWLICLALAVVTIAVYWRVFGYDFVDYDDPDYVTKNPMVMAGLSFKGVLWAFTHTYASNWHPLTWISLMLDRQLFGLHAGGFHVENVALHAANAVVLFILLWRLTRAQWRSAIVAALFALHPMHVESVAWISERKDVLSTFFGLLALLAYVQYVEQSKVQSPKSKIWHPLALFLFALGLLAKPMLVTLPFIMLLLDFWPLQRIENIGWRSFFTPQFGRLVREKWAWFALSAVSCALTFYAQKTGGAVADVKHFPLFFRMFVAIEAYYGYIQKLFWPTHLAVFYPMEQQHSLLLFLITNLLLLTVSIFAVRGLKRWPFFLIGWLWFLGTLIPVIGIVQVGMQGMADRYSYLPSIGLFIAVIWGGYELVKGSKLRSMVARYGIGIVLAVLATATVFQAGVWRSTLVLFAHAFSVTRNNVTALGNYGVALSDLGRYSEALAAYNAALKAEPYAADIHKNAGLALIKLSRPDEALVQFEQAAQYAPNDDTIQNVLAVQLQDHGKKEEALEHFETAAKLKPDNAQYQNDLGVALAAAGRKADALPHYGKAAELESTNAFYQNNFATALARAGQQSAAIEHYRMAIQNDPKFAEPYSNLGALLAAQQHFQEAAHEYSEAVRLDPTNATMRLNAGLVLMKLRRNDDAMNQLAEAVRLNPKLADARYELGRQLLFAGQFQPALEQLQQAVQLKPDYAPANFYLGLACLKLHLEPEGLKHLQEAARLRPDWAEPLNAQAWTLATSPDDKIRNATQAIALGEQAVKLTSRREPEMLQTLAAAYAEAGRFDEAIATANEAIQLVHANAQSNLAARIQEALELYKAHRPFREKTSAE